jgi:NAD-dependent dihydropyrimidine dehydrogenase PreA subunit
VIEETVCVGCGKCAKSCPAGCIEMKERTAM